MPIAYNTLMVHPEKCNGCGDCEVACAKVKANSTDVAHSRIKVIKNLTEEFHGPVVCLQCGDPNCVRSCPGGALTKNPETGVVVGNKDKCVSCTICTLACPYGGITYNPVIGNVMKCDHCGGDPECVKVCKTGALVYSDEATVYKEQIVNEDLFGPDLAACMGCNMEILVRHALRHIGPDTVLMAPPGCLPGVCAVGFNGATGTKIPTTHPLLSNTASMAAGLRRYYKRIGRDVTSLCLAGDGGAADVGFQSLSGAAERGEEILFVCIDNEGYMNTGMQRSGTTPFGSWTSTTPVGPALKGKPGIAKSMPLIMLMHNCEYVGTASTAFIKDFHEKLEKAHQASKRGFAYLHVFSPCTTGWRFPGDQTIEVQRKAVATNFFPLWEYERQTGQFRFTHSVDDPEPLENYIKMLGKFRHLGKEEIEILKKTAAERLKLLKAFASSLEEASQAAS
ncbi:MAG TPA: thiamine pyrophosphate-dependent enzyme [Thermodesulfobacteriota bacterium]|nr:thiamine pyrophosphate-dependent enzyme [Thermodesulfobacteriota bacterium]